MLINVNYTVNLKITLCDHSIIEKRRQIVFFLFELTTVNMVKSPMLTIAKEELAVNVCNTRPHLSKHGTFTQCCFNVGLASKTVAQH